MLTLPPMPDLPGGADFCRPLIAATYTAPQPATPDAANQDREALTAKAVAMASGNPIPGVFNFVAQCIAARKLGHLFHPGLLVLTPGVQHALGDLRASTLRPCLERHLTGDWGDNRTPEDIRANADDLAFNGRLLSAYANVTLGSTVWIERLWIITERSIVGDEDDAADPLNRLRSVTTILLPSEY